MASTQFYLFDSSARSCLGEISGAADRDCRLRQARLAEGRRLGSIDWPIDIHFSRQSWSKAQRLDIVTTSAPFPVISKKLADFLITECPDCVELFPIRAIVGSEAACECHFLALNMTRLINVIDLEASDYVWAPSLLDPSETVILTFRTIVQLPKLGNVPPLFREHSYSQYALMSGELKKKCQSAKFKIHFLSLDQMARPGLRDIEWTP